MLTERKTNLNTAVPQLLKIMAKKCLKRKKLRTEKWLAQIFRKYLTEKNLENI